MIQLKITCSSKTNFSQRRRDILVNYVTTNLGYSNSLDHYYHRPKAEQRTLGRAEYDNMNE